MEYFALILLHCFVKGTSSEQNTSGKLQMSIKYRHTCKWRQDGYKLKFYLYFKLEVCCLDTPSWLDPDGYTCKDYFEDNFCENGNIKPGKENYRGYSYHSPEANCCVCGKDQSIHFQIS